MSSYLESDDSSEDEGRMASSNNNHVEMSESEIDRIKNIVLSLKNEGNACFSASNFEEAVRKYTEAINTLKSSKLPKDPIILLNRSATYLSLKRYVPALNDSNQAISVDPDNWKGHWRKGVALMSMSKRLFRTKQAIEAFERCGICSTLPLNKKTELASELSKAKFRLEQQEAETPAADLSNCAPS